MANAKVTKQDVIQDLSVRLGISKTEAEKYLSNFLGLIEDYLKEGKDVALTGFGTFKKTTRAARKGINPQTQEPIDIAASTSVSFKVGKNLKEAVQ